MLATKTNRNETLTLWREFQATRSRVLRNRLMEIYFPIVKYNAERLSAKLPDEVDVNDLVSAGVFGLVDAIEAFEIGRASCRERV